tara:strand:- start:4547 stop:5911 length:1365 start_codon:yes stop_codon:yes gene_type:complete
MFLWCAVMVVIKKLKLFFRFIVLDALFCKKRINILNKRAKLSHEDIADLQNRLLLETLFTATKKLNAYKDLKLPNNSSNIQAYISRHCRVISKEDLLTKRSEYYPHGGKSSLFQIIGKSSGTTGTPLEVLRSYDSILWENSFVKRHWQNVTGINKYRRATLRGDQIGNSDKKPYWLFNKIERQLILASRSLNNETCAGFVSVINKFNPDMLQAYPSTAFQLAQYVKSNNLKINIPIVFTGSEMLYQYQRDVIEQTIGKVCDFYGMAERVAMATECRFKNLHVNTDYSYVEILDDDDQSTDQEGYVVGTTLHNHCMPLIRYKLSDRTKWKKGQCECGSNYPMIEPIAGKFEDTLYDINKNPISPSLITFAFKGVNQIEKSQVAQTEVDKWVIRVVPAAKYQAKDGEQIIDNLKELVSKNINAEILLVKVIPRTKAGKFRWVINEMSKSVEENVDE